MKCLSRIEIQEFLDKEIEPSLMARMSDHIEKCENCSMLFRQAVADKALIGKVIGMSDTTEDSIPVPEFVLPVLNKKRITFYKVIPYLVAASVIGIIFLFRSDKTPVLENIPEAEILLYEFYDGKDLNRMWHEKSQIIILQDEKGNVIQSIITN